MGHGLPVMVMLPVMLGRPLEPAENQQIPISYAPLRDQQLDLLFMGQIEYSAPQYHGFSSRRGYVPMSPVS